MTNNSPIHPDAIASRLIRTRTALGLTQAEFADKVDITRNAYNMYENGKRRPSIEAAFQMNQHYKITFDWIFIGDPSGLPQRLFSKIEFEDGNS